MAIEVANWKQDLSCGYPLAGWVCVGMRLIADIVEDIQRKLESIMVGSMSAHDIYSSRCFPMGVSTTTLCPMGNVVVSVLRVYEGMYQLRVNVIGDDRPFSCESVCFKLITYMFQVDRGTVWKVAEIIQSEFDSNNGWATY